MLKDKSCRRGALKDDVIGWNPGVGSVESMGSSENDQDECTGTDGETLGAGENPVRSRASRVNDILVELVG